MCWIFKKLTKWSDNIANLINYDPKIKSEDPLLQGKVSYTVDKVCKSLGYEIESTSNALGGLGYYYKFKRKK